MPDERVRLFVALELPEAARDALVSWRDHVLGRARELRPLPADSLHATLCFLGSRAADEVGAIAAACAVVAAEPAPRLSLGQSRWLPSRRPRVLAVELLDPSGALRRIQASLSEMLATGGWYEPEKRPYLPHVTVARATGEVSTGRRPLPALAPLEFQGLCVTLFRSRLSRSGARYEALARVALAGGGKR